MIIFGFWRRHGIVVVVAAVGLIACSQEAPKVADKAPFGGPNSVEYAKSLWTELEKAKLVGDNPIHSNFYPGFEPHGFALEVFDTEITGFSFDYSSDSRQFPGNIRNRIELSFKIHFVLSHSGKLFSTEPPVKPGFYIIKKLLKKKRLQ